VDGATVTTEFVVIVVGAAVNLVSISRQVLF
jgi:hypothetical protein